MNKATHHHHEKTEPIEYFKFAGIIVFLLILSALLTVFSYSDTMRFMELFMGSFFVTFGIFKFINFQSFVTAFTRYDIIAKRSELYAKLFPFIELLLGVSFLLGNPADYVLYITIVLMLVSSIGVIKVLRKNDQTILCACMGTIIKLPVTTITLVENLGMGAMALALLLL